MKTFFLSKLGLNLELNTKHIYTIDPLGATVARRNWESNHQPFWFLENHCARWPAFITSKSTLKKNHVTVYH